MSSISRDHFRACSQQTVPVCWGHKFLVYSFSLFILLAVNVSVSSVASAQDGAETKVNTEELVTEEEVKAQKRALPNFFKTLAKTSLNQADILVIKSFLRIQVLQMSLDSKKLELSAIRKKIKQNFIRARQPATDLLLPEITKQCEKLLKHPLPVRLNAVMLITELNQTRFNAGKKQAAVPYEGKAGSLIAIVSDPSQHQAVKVVAVNGLHRLCKDANLKIDLRKKIATALIKELKNSETEPWYQRVCIETLGVVNDLYDTQRKPYIVQMLCEILIDNQRPWLVRAGAACSLGRTKMDGQINLPLINYEVARFTYDLGLQHNQKPRSYHWKMCFFQAYSAYRKKDARDTAWLDRVKNASLSKHKTIVEAAYQRILPVVNEVIGRMKPQTISKKTLEDLKKFIDENPPANLSVAPGSKPLREAKKVPAKK